MNSLGSCFTDYEVFLDIAKVEELQQSETLTVRLNEESREIAKLSEYAQLITNHDNVSCGNEIGFKVLDET